MSPKITCIIPQVRHVKQFVGNVTFNANVTSVYVARLWLRTTWRCCFPAQEPWSRPSSSSSKSSIYCLCSQSLIDACLIHWSSAEVHSKFLPLALSSFVLKSRTGPSSEVAFLVLKLLWLSCLEVFVIALNPVLFFWSPCPCLAPLSLP